MKFVHFVFWTIISWSLLILLVSEPKHGKTNAQLRVEYLNALEECRRVAKKYPEYTNPAQDRLCEDRARRVYEESHNAN